MSDIAAEMRKAAELRGDTYSSMEIWGLLGRGAAEIERLRAERDAANGELAERFREIERLSDDVCPMTHNAARCQRAELRAEVERLRAARDKFDLEAQKLSAEVERLKAALAESCGEGDRFESATMGICPRAAKAEAEIERLQTGWELATKAVDTNESLRAQLTEAAAVLDRVAEHLDRWLINEQFSADCRTMAKKLRSET